MTSLQQDGDDVEETFSERGIDVPSNIHTLHHSQLETESSIKREASLESKKETLTTSGSALKQLQSDSCTDFGTSVADEWTDDPNLQLPVHLPGFRSTTENHLHPALERNLRHNSRDVTDAQRMISSGEEMLFSWWSVRQSEDNN